MLFCHFNLKYEDFLNQKENKIILFRYRISFLFSFIVIVIRNDSEIFNKFEFETNAKDLLIFDEL